MKFLILLSIFCSSVSWADSRELRLGLSQPKTSIETYHLSSEDNFSSMELGGQYIWDNNWYAGVLYNTFKNQSTLKWSSLRAVGGYRHPVTPNGYLWGDFGYGIGSMDEKAGETKISDHRGQVYSYEFGYSHRLPESFTLSLSYGFLNQSHGERETYTALKSQGFKLTVLYSF